MKLLFLHLRAFLIFLIFIIIFDNGWCSLTLVSEKEGNKQYLACIDDGDENLAIDVDLPSDRLTSSNNLIIEKLYSNYVSGNDFDENRQEIYSCSSDDIHHLTCDYIGQKITDKYIEEVNSGTHNIEPLLIDRRFERLPTFISYGNMPLYPSYVNVKDAYRVNNQKDKILEIGLSVKMEKDVKISLCNTEKPRYWGEYGFNHSTYEHKECYWFNLDSDGPNNMVQKIRRCKGGLPRDYPNNNENCAQNNNEIKEEIDLFSANTWTHIVLTYKIIANNNTKVLKIRDYQSNKIIRARYHDHNSGFDKNMNYLFFNGYGTNNNGIWKLHNYKYYSIKEEGKNKWIKISDHPISANETYFCLSLYIAICEKCSIQFSFDYWHNKWHNLLRETKTGSLKTAKWQREKFEFNIPGHNNAFNLKFYVWVNSTKAANNFWALDEIRRCRKEEYRVVHLDLNENNDDVSCQFLNKPQSKTNLKITNHSAINNLEESQLCSIPEKFGPKCNLDCFKIFEKYCHKKIICYNESCYCAPGYHNDYCGTECTKEIYGYKCKKSCGKCKPGTTCDIVNGVCPEGCQESYSGSRCDQGYFNKLLEAPIVKPGYRNATFTFINLAVSNETSGRPRYISIEYTANQNIVNPVDNWIESHKTYFIKNSTITISDLKPDTNYKYRSILYNDKGLASKSDIVHYFKTECVTEDFSVSSTKDSCTFQLQIVPDACDSEYKIKYPNNTENTLKFDRRNDLKIATVVDLSPYTEYLYFKNDIEIEHCLTLEDAPSEVTSLTVQDIRKDSAKVSWGEPEQKNGIIIGYIVTYKVIKHLHCQDDLSSTYNAKNITRNPNEKLIDLKQLTPYTKYKVKVAGVTIGPGNYVEKEFDTHPEEKLLREEIPVDISNNTSSNEISIQWIEVCEKIYGEISYEINTICLDEWCHGEATRNEYPDNNDYNRKKKGFAFYNNVTIKQLTPFTNYSVKMIAKRNEYENTVAEFVTQTIASAPPIVTELQIYAKDVDRVSLRWKKPYPPHGTLTNYAIHIYHDYDFDNINKYYVASKSFKSIEITANTTCHLYEDCECYTWHLGRMRDADRKSFKFIIIAAINKEINVNGVDLAIGPFRLSETVSSEPRNLTFKWGENNSLILSWKHPWMPNGYIKAFLIYKNNTERVELLEQYLVNETTQEYNYVVETKLYHSSTYNIHIRARSSQLGDASNSIIVDVPPEKPTLIRNMSVNNATLRNTSFILTIPPAELESLSEQNHQTLMIFEDSTHPLENDCNSLENMCKSRNVINFWTISESEIKTNRVDYKIGYENASYENLSLIRNKPERLSETKFENRVLSPGTQYKVVLVMRNEYRNMIECQIYELEVETPTKNPNSKKLNKFNFLWGLLVLLLIFPIVLFFVIKRLKNLKNRNVERSSILNDPRMENSNTPDVIPMDKVNKNLRNTPAASHEPTSSHVEIKPKSKVQKTTSGKSGFENVNFLPENSQKRSMKTIDGKNRSKPKTPDFKTKESHQSVKKDVRFNIQHEKVKIETPKMENNENIEVKPELLPRKSKKVKNLVSTENLTEKSPYSKRVPLDQFENYVRQSIENGDLDAQHALFPRGQTKPWDYGIRKENKMKNRYNNLIAYDETRVVLEKIEGDPFSDYINASYIDGYCQKRAYIATQGPKPTTVNDFWRMIWQENVENIIMLANIIENGKKKCEQYWPSLHTHTYGDIKVRFLESELFADYEHRYFEISYKKEVRRLEQFHFLSWPDHGVPLYPQLLTVFLQRILKISHETPTVVHCSAGVGRTGTIILSDICCRMAAKEGHLDVLKFLHQIREQRANLVDNADQYKLVHMVLVQILLTPPMTLNCNNLRSSAEEAIQENSLESQMEYLEQIAWQDKVFGFYSKIEIGEANITKNRFGDVLPDIGRVYIPRYPPTDENSDYINAVFVDGFRCKNQFIVTQIPLPNTYEDFWRMICHTNCQVIVSLNDIPKDDQTCCQLLVPNLNENLTLDCGIVLKTVKVVDYEIYQIISIQVCSNGHGNENNENFGLKLLQYRNWEPQMIHPGNLNDFANLVIEYETLSRGKTPVTVMCHDAVTASGLFVSFAFIAEKMKFEQLCDVYLAVRIARRNRPQFITDKVQLKFLYMASALYMQQFDTYANFQ